MRSLAYGLGLGWVFLAAACAWGQPLPDALFTAGTTAMDGAGRPWGYVVFRSTDEAVLRGREWTVHRKRGLPGDAGGFERIGRIAPERDVGVLAVLVERGRQLGEDTRALESTLSEVYRLRVGNSGGGGEAERPSLARLLAGLLARGDGDAETGRWMRMLGQAHPSVRMALGEAWAGPLGVAPGQPVTLEIRESLPGGGGDGGVVGRVTLTAGRPVVLPPPGAPVQVSDTSPKGDLNVKLRWGQGDELRRQAPLATGFQVWRVSRAFAVARGVDGVAPGPGQLRQWADAGDAVRVGDGSVLVSRVLGPAEAADEAFEPGLYYLVDDGNRYRTGADGRPVDEPMAEGTEATYFVCSLDLLGRAGPPSLPGHGVFCRTLPPPVPSGLQVENHWEPNGATGTQSFAFRWKANVATARDVTDYYEVYRGTNLVDLQSEAGKAGLVPVMPRVESAGGGTELWVIDAAPEVTSAEFGKTYWYSVRAVHESPCGPIRSDFAAPVTIARRQREGPAAPKGHVDVACAGTSVKLERQQTVSDATLPANDGMVRLRILCGRDDAGVADVDIGVRAEGRDVDLGRHVFAAEGDWVAADFEIHRNALPSRTVWVTVRSTGHAGVGGPATEVAIEDLTSEGVREVVFRTRTQTLADLVPGDGYSDAWLEGPVGVQAGVLPGGVGVAVVPASLEGRRVVLETSPLAVAVPSYRVTGHGRVREGRLYFGVAEGADGQASSGLSGRVYPVKEWPGAECVDVAYHPGTGVASKLGVTFFPTARSAEFRLFRRIDEGPYTLVAQGAAESAGAAESVIRRDDGALPATDCTICYYVQTVDRDGNGSALVRLEGCVERRSPTLPKPLLGPPEARGTETSAVMRLVWSCPPQGVERFLVTIRAKGGAAAKSALESASKFAMVASLGARVVQYFGAGDDGAREVSNRAAGVGGVGESSEVSTVLPRLGGGVAFQKMIQTSAFVTPRLGDGFPAGPPYVAEFEVQPGVPYTVFVQAVRGPMFGGQGRGPASGKHEFRWSDPKVAKPAVAWPARPLEAVVVQAGVEASELHPVLWPTNLDGQRPVGVRLARIPDEKGEDILLEGAEVIHAPAPDSASFRRHDPNGHLLGGLGDGVTPMQSVVLYRQQVANGLYPAVEGATVQVTPLIRKIAWIPTTTNDGRRGARLVDPFFGITRVASAIDLWLLDTHGVVDGARYHYYLVCFGGDGEVRRTIDAGFYGPN